MHQGKDTQMKVSCKDFGQSVQRQCLHHQLVQFSSEVAALNHNFGYEYAHMPSAREATTIAAKKQLRMADIAHLTKNT